MGSGIWWKVIAHLWKQPDMEAATEIDGDVRYLAAVIFEGCSVEEIDWERVTPEAVFLLQDYIHVLPTWEECCDDEEARTCAERNPAFDVALAVRANALLAEASPARRPALRKRFF